MLFSTEGLEFKKYKRWLRTLSDVLRGVWNWGEEENNNNDKGNGKDGGQG